jgi:hypothetical protein
MIESPKKLINEGLVSVLKTVIEKYMSRGPTARAKNGTGSLKLAPMHATIDGRELSNSHSRACRINANNTTATDTPASCKSNFANMRSESGGDLSTRDDRKRRKSNGHISIERTFSDCMTNL